MVRAIVRDVAWLDGPVAWQMGRVVWHHPQRGIFAPTPADLALVQRHIHTVQRFAIAARYVVGDVSAWLAQRCTSLATAVLLQALVAPDLPDLAAQGPAHHPGVRRRLADLLLAEALCTNALPTSPAQALLACGRAASPVLRRTCRDERLPTVGRALAALTLGALHQREEQPVAPATDWHMLADPWLRRAFAWGQQHGLPTDLWVCLRLLAAPDGTTLALRYREALQATRHFRPSDDMLRELVAGGVAPAQVVALLEALAKVEPVGRRILVAPPRKQKSKRSRILRPVAFALAARRQAVADLGSILLRSAQATADPEAIRLVGSFCMAMLTLAPLCPNLVAALLLPLQEGLDLPAPLQRPYLGLLVSSHSIIWKSSTIPADKGAKGLAGWLSSRWEESVLPLLTVLRESGDPTVAGEALKLSIISSLAQQRMPPDRYPILLDILRRLQMQRVQRMRILRILGRLLNNFDTPQEARAVLLPLVAVIAQASLENRGALLIQLLHAIEESTGRPGPLLRRLLPYVVRLTRSAHLRNVPRGLQATMVPGILAIARAQPVQGVAWFERVLACLRSRPESDLTKYATWSTLNQGMRLAVVLADDDLPRFEALLDAVLRHQLEPGHAALEAGIDLLARFPGVRLPLRQLFGQQPQRCARLVARLGNCARLGGRSLDPLRDLEPDPAAFLVRHALPADWEMLLAAAPDLLLLAGTYLHARHLCGADLHLPGGVRRALQKPQKLHNEAEHLAALVAHQPARTDLVARLASLRARLANVQHLRQQAHCEARERLRQITAEAQLAAAEQQLLACFREQLEAVVGPWVPADLVLDDDLLNALLLLVHIRTNRRLLRDLLRAYLRGDHGWREQQPANGAFLQQLAAQGVQVATWLSSFPRTYPCAGARGGRVWLALEHDPLRILQMGNHFATCLSVGWINDFSTVANACELNKRVLYVRDATGRVVGRKLLAINDAGDLVGFYSYASLDDEHGKNCLRAIMREYSMLFAAQCGLRVSGEGRVPILFAQDWYDDGIFPWDEEEQRADAAAGEQEAP